LRIRISCYPGELLDLFLGHGKLFFQAVVGFPKRNFLIGVSLVKIANVLVSVTFEFAYVQFLQLEAFRCLL
jgi:hypothetical protein